MFSALSIRRLSGLALVVLVLGILAVGLAVGTASAQTSRGLQVGPEYRCSPYDVDDYRYPQSVDDRITAELGGVPARNPDGQYYPFLTLDIDNARRLAVAHLVTVKDLEALPCEADEESG